MDKIMYIITGGFLKGYRSYILGIILIVQAVASWAVGDMSFMTLMEQLPELLAGAGIMAAAVHDT